MPSKDAESIEVKAQKVWDGAEDNLKQLDSAHLFSAACVKCRDFPKFEASEVVQGNKLGKGGFSNVFEVIDIRLQNESNTESNENGDAKKKEETWPKTTKHTQFQSNTSTMPDADDDDKHYDVATAKQLIQKRCLRFGASRYAIKRLRPDLDKLEYARGALDLAIEIKFLSCLEHPNIVKMRAVSNTPRLSLETFIVMGG